jgi:hypothetical protein
MDSALADRLAKLLRLACSTGPDGEKLAAIGRVSAIVAANSVDWDAVLANGNGSALTEEAMSRIYSEGYERGHRDGQQQARPARDWTPAGDTKAEAGADAERIELILNAAAESRDAGLLSDWEITFSNDMRERFERYGSRMYISEKQWTSLDRLETKMRRAGTL